jgi:hypothetical protein
MNANPGIYTHRHKIDGNVGIGKLSSDTSSSLETIAAEYLSHIPDQTATTHHTYCTDLKGRLKTEFDKIQFADIWQGLRNGAFESPDSFATILHNIIQMNEIYYSNPRPNFKAGPLYGAAANLIPHRDCILFYFPGIRVYRIIIGTTNGNSDTTTEFITHGVERQLNKGDYMVFDFDRTLHQVKKTGQTPTPRILLKLHFLALDMNYARHPLVWIYVKFASVCYIIYYRVARYTEQLGTDPKTYVGFFFGILWEYPFYPKVRYSIAAVYSGLIANRLLYSSHFRVGSPTLLRSAIAPIIVYSTLDLVAVYCLIVAFVWFIESRKKIISSVKEDK